MQCKYLWRVGQERLVEINRKTSVVHILHVSTRSRFGAGRLLSHFCYFHAFIRNVWSCRTKFSTSFLTWGREKTSEGEMAPSILKSPSLQMGNQEFLPSSLGAIASKLFSESKWYSEVHLEFSFISLFCTAFPQPREPTWVWWAESMGDCWGCFAAQGLRMVGMGAKGTPSPTAELFVGYHKQGGQNHCFPLPFLWQSISPGPFSLLSGSCMAGGRKKKKEGDLQISVWCGQPMRL